jgi:hypothetical protein
MKKFIIRSILLSIPLVALFYVKPLYLLYGKRYQRTVQGSEIYHSIDKSKRVNPSKRLIIGDSTAKQLFDNNDDNDTLNSLACNQCIGVVGHFFLLNNYLKTGNRPDIVYMVYNPLSFVDNLDQVFTYHYFIKPFYTDEYKPLMTNTVLTQIDKIPCVCFAHYSFILTSNWAPNIKLKPRNYTFLSPISIEYLCKIDSLSKRYHFKYYIIPPFMCTSNKTKIIKMNRNEYTGYSFSDKFKDYFNRIIYLNDTCFRDSIHLFHPNAYQGRMHAILAKLSH